jgi:preprotein translocase subunit SecB
MPKRLSTSATKKGSNYESFLRSVKLYSLGLEELSAKLDRERYWKYFSENNGLTREIGATYKAINIDDDHFDVIADFQLRVTSEKEKNKVILEISCTYSVHFHASSDCNADTAQRFANSEAKIIVWPYLRSIVSDTTGRMYIPPLTIPLALD